MVAIAAPCPAMEGMESTHAVPCPALICLGASIVPPTHAVCALLLFLPLPTLLPPLGDAAAGCGMVLTLVQAQELPA